MEKRTIETAAGVYARIRFMSGLAALGRPYEFKVIEDSIGFIGYYRCDDPENGGGNSALDDEFMQYISPMPFRTFDRVPSSRG